jgi:hypothetical protein
MYKLIKTNPPYPIITLLLTFLACLFYHAIQIRI